MAKDPAAVSLGKKRWEGKSEEERLSHALMMNQKRTKKTTEEQRIESARKAAAARWGKKTATDPVASSELKPVKKQ